MTGLMIAGGCLIAFNTAVLITILRRVKRIEDKIDEWSEFEPDGPEAASKPVVVKFEKRAA